MPASHRKLGRTLGHVSPAASAGTSPAGTRPWTSGHRWGRANPREDPHTRVLLLFPKGLPEPLREEASPTLSRDPSGALSRRAGCGWHRASLESSRSPSCGASGDCWEVGSGLLATWGRFFPAQHRAGARLSVSCLHPASTGLLPEPSPLWARARWARRGEGQESQGSPCPGVALPSDVRAKVLGETRRG